MDIVIFFVGLVVGLVIAYLIVSSPSLPSAIVDYQPEVMVPEVKRYEKEYPEYFMKDWDDAETDEDKIYADVMRIEEMHLAEEDKIKEYIKCKINYWTIKYKLQDIKYNIAKREFDKNHKDSIVSELRKMTVVELIAYKNDVEEHHNQFSMSMFYRIPTDTSFIYYIVVEEYHNRLGVKPLTHA